MTMTTSHNLNVNGAVFQYPEKVFNPMTNSLTTVLRRVVKISQPDDIVMVIPGVIKYFEIDCSRWLRQANMQEGSVGFSLFLQLSDPSYYGFRLVNEMGQKQHIVVGTHVQGDLFTRGRLKFEIMNNWPENTATIPPFDLFLHEQSLPPYITQVD